jgi:hypothetical protein
MRHAARIASLGTLLVCGLVALAASSAFGWAPPAKWEAGTCNGTQLTVKNCEYTSPTSVFYTQAAGHPPWGLTGFEVAHSGSGESRRPEETLKRIRVDVPPGLAADPQTLPACSRAAFNAGTCNALTKAGFVELEAFVGAPVNKVLTLEGNVWNLEQEAGLPLLFGIEVKGVPPLVENTLLLLEGHVSYAKEPVLEARGVPSGDFHEWFEINNIPPEVSVKLGPLPIELAKAKLQTLKSKLFFNGRAGNGNFLTLPSECGPPSKSTSYLELEDEKHEITSAPTVPPVGVDGCKNVPFTPNTQVKPQATGYDQPDGAITNVLVPQNEAEGEINTADIASGHALFPEGLTLNPSAAHGLQACAPSQMHFETKEPAACPAGSRLGSVAIETDLPKGSLTGSVYLASPSGTPIKGPPYTIYVVAESVYDVKVKVEATVTPDPNTGRLKVDVVNSTAHPFNLPQLPFASAILELNTGNRAPLANPLSCAGAKTESDLIAYSGEEIFKELKPSFAFPTTGCPSPIPFALTQNTQTANATAGAFSPYTFNLSRADGQQYLSQVSTTLPAGLLGAIPSVALCGEPQAAQGTCAASSQIGTATVTAGAGGEPYPFSGPVFLTGPYDGAPYGLSIPVPVLTGSPPTPTFNLGTVVTRATINVDPHTARVTVTSTNLPTIVGGVPVRLKTLKVEVNRPSFIFNPTNCGALATESTLSGFTALGSSVGVTQSLSTPFQVGNCVALPFKPSFKVSTSAKTSRATGASLQVSLTQGAHQANMRSVFVQLPKQLPSRLTTLQKACPEATFAANPVNCRKLGSEVGTATVMTPVLPGKLTGSAYLVSHGGEAFPDLDIVLEGDGVKVTLVGNTSIKHGITSSTFAAIPDVPVSSFALSLPVGAHSVLTANGSLCKKPLTMPTTITGQNGAVIKQSTRISVSGCPVEIVSHRIVGHKLVLKVKTFAAGRISVKGKNLKTVSRRLGKATTTTLKIPLSRGGLKALDKARQKHRRLKVRVRVGFAPKQKGESVSAASVGVTFR